jgi:hypothetical protein
MPIPKSFIPDGQPGSLPIPKSFVPDSPTPDTPAPLYSGGFKQDVKDFGTEVKSSYSDPKNPVAGVIKGAGSTLFGAAKAGQKIGNALSKIPGFGWLKSNATPEQKPDFLVPQGTGQKIGFGVEQLAEYLLPAANVLKGAKAVNAAAEASKLPTAAKIATKILGKAGLESLSAGTVATAQSGSPKEGVKTGVTVGALSTAAGALGAATKQARQNMAEKLYSQIFKNSNDDMVQMLKSGALQDLQKTNPERFQELVKQGIIKAGPDGVVEFDPTLAREALDRGLRGSIKNMSNEVVRQTLDMEQKARAIAANTPTTVKIENSKNYINLLKQVQTQYKGTFFPERGNLAGEFVKKLQSGELSGEDTLRLRRFLDNMRVASSFRPNAHISVGQEDFKAASDQLRGKLNSIPGMKEVMNEYRFNIEALNSLAKEAARRGNSAVINLIDTALFGFGGGLAGPEGAAAFPLVRRALTLPSVVTGVGSKLESTGSGKFGTLFRGAIGSQIPTKE